MSSDRGREMRAFRLIQPEELGPLKVFCGHCADRPEVEPHEPIVSRVCARCGLGLLLETSPDMAPARSDPFLVVDTDLAIRAISRRAEAFLKVAEPEAVGRHLNEFLAPADVNTPATQSFFALVMLAATGSAEPHTVAVRPADLFGVRYWARVGTCGPSNAALLVLATV